MTLFKILLVYFLLSAISRVVESEEEPDCSVKAHCVVPSDCLQLYEYEKCIDGSPCDDKIKKRWKKLHANGLEKDCEAERPLTTTTPKAEPESTTTPPKPTTDPKTTAAPTTTTPAANPPAPSCDAECPLVPFNFTVISVEDACESMLTYLGCVQGKNCTTKVSENLKNATLICGELFPSPQTTPPAAISPAPSCDAKCPLEFDFMKISEKAACEAFRKYLDCVEKQNCKSKISESLKNITILLKCDELFPPAATHNPSNTTNPSNATDPANGSNPMTTATSLLFLFFANAWIALANKIF